MWLNPNLIGERYQATTFIEYESSWQKPYEVWNHCETILKENKSSFYLVDAITSLKRCMDIRLRQIKTIYNLSKIPIIFYSKGLLENLEELGIVRFYLLKKLLGLRNSIEHEHLEPPTIDICFEYLDIVWYFLKSTDKFVQSPVREIELDNKTRRIHINSFTFESQPFWQISCLEWLNKRHFSNTKKENWIEIEPMVSSKSKDIKILETDKNKVFISFNIIGPEKILQKLFKYYFSTV